MRKTTTAAILAVCTLAPALAQAQTTTAVGTGIGTSEANSASGAVAVDRGNGSSSSNNSLVVNNPANVTSTVSGVTTQNINQRQSGSVKTVPSMVAPGLAAAGLETCLGSASGTVSALGWGVGGGSTYPDEGCQARLDSRPLYSYGLKEAAVARLCQRADIWRSMPAICERYWPQGVPYPAGIVVVNPRANVVMSANGSALRIIDGRDGVEKDCYNYSYSKQKCYQWAGEKPRVAHVAAVQPTKLIPKPRPVMPAAMPAQPKPPATPAEAPKPESKPEDKKS